MGLRYLCFIVVSHCRLRSYSINMPLNPYIYHKTINIDDVMQKKLRSRSTHKHENRDDLTNQVRECFI